MLMLCVYIIKSVNDMLMQFTLQSCCFIHTITYMVINSSIIMFSSVSISHGPKTVQEFIHTHTMYTIRVIHYYGTY